MKHKDCPHCGERMEQIDELTSRRIVVYACPECGVRAEEMGVKKEEDAIQ